MGKLIRTKSQLMKEMEALNQYVEWLERLDTERQHTEENIKRAAEDWRTTFDSITDFISIHDRDFRITRVNMAFADAFNIKPQELIGKTCYEVIHRTREPWPNCPHARVLETSEPQMIEIFEPNLRIHLELSAAPIFNEKGEITSTVHIAKDITERKQMEETLRESEERYRALVDLRGEVDEAVVMIQDTNMATGAHTFFSDTWIRITGYSREELLSMSFFDLVHPRDRPMCLEGHRRRMEGENLPGLFELSIIRKDGNEAPIELTSAYTVYRGEKAGVSYIRDTTERKKMQEQLTVTDRLASVGELASGIAHELNNPLTSVIGFSQLLLEKDVPNDIKKDIEVIYQEAHRASEVVKNLLTFARKHTPERQLVNINNIIDNILELRAYEQKVSNIQLNKQLAIDLPEVMADYFQLQQVFLNIIINAEYFMIEANNKGTLSITTQSTGDTITASFADDGPGISKEIIGHVFDPFFTTKEIGKGTGLGLSICHGIITEHGGRIYVQSEPGAGTTFIVELPVSQG